MTITFGYAELALAFLCFLIVVLCGRWNTNSPIRNWPVVGMLPGLLHNAWRVHEYATLTLKESGHTYVFKGPWFVNMDFVITSDPVNVHHILSKNSANYPKGPKFKMIMDALGDGLITSDGDSWRIQRKMIHSLMKHSKFQSALENTIHRKLEKGLIPLLEHTWKQGIVVDLQDVFQRFTFDSMCLLILGVDPNCLTVELPQVLFEKAYDAMEECAFQRHILPLSFWKLQRWLQIGGEYEYKRASETVDKFIYECISSKKEKLSRREFHMEEEEGLDLLTACMLEAEEEQVKEDALRKSDKFLRDTIFNLLSAGRGTVSAALTWFLWLIATHPLVENKIFEEIKANILQAEMDGEVRLFRAQELDKLVYLHAALCETLRLYPPVPFNHKAAAQPVMLPSGHHVNQNTNILISYFSMGRMEELWGKDCLEFKPQRWMTERGCIAHIPSYKFASFSGGPRICIGKGISFIQMKIISSAIIFNYHVKVVEGHPIIPQNSITLQMKHGLKVRISKRCFKGESES